MKMDISLPLKRHDYSVIIEELLKSIIPLLKKLKPSKIAILTDDKIATLHGLKLKSDLEKEGFSISLITFPAGEASKTRKTKEVCEDKLLENLFGRDSSLIALGGGVVTDLGGFIASTFARGIPCFLIPTSLLGMVDAAIGGKTAVDVPQGKNLIGTFYPPEAVIIDINFLKSLPLIELKNGCAEMLKHGLIADKNYFEFLIMNAEKILAKDDSALIEAIKKSCEIKIKHVVQDANEKGKRRLLNFGHTIGHALESAAHFQISHGKAVALGSLAESKLSQKMGFLSDSEFDKIETGFKKFNFDLSLSSINRTKLIELMMLDKKSKNNNPRFVLLEEIGKPATFNGEYCSVVENPVLNETLDWLIKCFA